MLADLVRSLRLLRQHPGFALLAGFTLALGIGLNTAMFSVIHAVLLAPLPYPDPDRVVSVNTEFTKEHRNIARVAGGDLLDLQKERGIFQTFGFYAGWGQVGVQLNNRAEFTGVAFATPGFLQVLNVAPLKGRWFTGEDHDSAVISRVFAIRNFGTVEAALDRTVSVENTVYRITGVVPAALDFPGQTDLWVQLPEHPDNVNRSAYNYRAVARLATTLDAANARLRLLGTQLAAVDADDRDKSFLAVPLQDQMTGTVRGTLWILMCAVALVLIIACSNAANLMLARATGRTREIAVRLALGARRGHLVRQLLSESLTLALPGAIAGVVLAYWALDLVVRLAPSGMARLDRISVNLPALAFALGISILSALVAGLAPAIQLAGGGGTGAQSLQLGTTRGATSSSRSARLRNALVVGEIALSVVLAIGSALLLRTFLKLNVADLGFDKHNVLVVYAHAPAKGLKEAVAASRLFSRLLSDLASIPGVASAGAAMGMPAGQYSSDGQYEIDGKELPKGLKGPQALFRLASPNYFSTMTIPLIRGRDFTAQDAYEAPFVAIISASLAGQSFASGQDPIGRRIRCGLDSDRWMTVVGVVADVKSLSPARAAEPELYMPLEQHPFMANEVQLAVRTKPGIQLAALAEAVRTKVREQNPHIALRFTTLDEMLDGAVSSQRFRAFLVTAFAVLAVFLTIAGVYGLMSFWTLQRTPEIGLRMALGATPGELVRSILVQAVRLGGAGLMIGIPAALVASRTLEGMLFGLQTTDAGTYALAALAVMVTTAGAAALPAWRASRVDPLVALRQE